MSELRIVKETREEWERVHKRRMAKRVLYGQLLLLPRVLQHIAVDQPSLANGTDIMPMLLVEAMPVEEYPNHLLAMIGYTLAQTGVNNPWLTGAVWSRDWVALGTAVVASRVGVWASVGEAAKGVVSHNALRWSASTTSLVVRPATAGDGTELWRHIAGGCSTLSETHLAAARAITWISPSSLVVAGSRQYGGTRAYGAAGLRREIVAYLMADAAVRAIWGAEADGLMEVVEAAALGAFPVTTAVGLAEDRMYSLAAQIRLGGSNTSELKKWLSDTTAEVSARSPSTGSNLSSGWDNMSVADTEGGLDVATAHASPVQVAEIPDLDVQGYEELTAAIRAVNQMPQPVNSLVGMQRGAMTEHGF